MFHKILLMKIAIDVKITRTNFNKKDRIPSQHNKKEVISLEITSFM